MNEWMCRKINEDGLKSTNLSVVYIIQDGKIGYQLLFEMKQEWR